MFIRIFLFLSIFTAVFPASAAGSIIAKAIFDVLVLTTFAQVATAFAINLVISAIVTKAFFSPGQPGSDSQASNPGNRQQVPPATSNKIPVVYGSAFVGGTVIDLSISQDDLELYYVFALSEVTGNGSDVFSFGDIYWAGKKVNFDSNGYTVNRLTDQSNNTQEQIDGKIEIFLYRNGSYSPVNSPFNAITVMSASNLIYKWDNTKLMTNCAFAIVKLKYSVTKNIRGLAPTKFQIINSRSSPGDCIYDYLTNTVYGAAIPEDQINQNSFNLLNTYSNETVVYKSFDGSPQVGPRFKFDGVVDTQRSVMQNLQDMASSCDCLIKYNEITSQWGVIVQSPSYTVAMNLNDSNIVSAINISPLDISASYNYIEVKFPNNEEQDSFDSANFDLAEIAPEFLFPNEPVNKFSISLPFVSESFRAQLIAVRLLKASREDLQVQLNINFVGLQLEAGDVVSVTNANYGWSNKLFRVNKIVEQFEESGAITAKLTLTEFNPQIWNDVEMTSFAPSPNTGIGDPSVFGSIPTPSVVAEYPANVNPLFLVQTTTPSSGLTQYAELWYSAYQFPTESQLFFVGTSEIQPDGNPYSTNTSLPAISVTNVPSGNWYFFSRMVNNIASSQFSPASSVFRWRPSTFQYIEKYLVIAYADSISGSGFSFNPRNKSYYGLKNQDSISSSSNPSDYIWYLADPTFGSNIFLCYSNRTGRKFSFDTGFATFAAGTGAFVPSQAAVFDPRIWSALPDGTNVINLDESTGQVLETGTTTVGTGEIEVINNPDGKVVAALKPYLNFGDGIYQKTSSVAQLTIDIYGRVVGFEPPDDFFFTKESFVATSGQTVFSVTRSSGYIEDQCLVFQNGCLLDTSEYTDTAGSTGTVTLSVGATNGDIITIVSIKSENSTSGVYASFTRNTATLTNANSYTASGFTLNSGYELLFLNGTIVNEFDYNIVGQEITDFPSNATGLLTIIQWSSNNLGTPNGDPVNIVTNTTPNQTIYTFSYNSNAFNLYSNGVLFLQGTDYNTGTGSYSLTNTPTTNQTIMVQQTFARTGAV